MFQAKDNKLVSSTKLVLSFDCLCVPKIAFLDNDGTLEA